MRSMTLDDWAPWDPADRTATPFAAAHVEELADRSGMHFPETVLGAATAALRAGEHVILTGRRGPKSPPSPSHPRPRRRQSLRCAARGVQRLLPAQLDQLDELSAARLLSLLDIALAPNERQAARALLDEFGLLAAVA